MLHIVDLSHRLVPGEQRFKLNINRFSVDEYIPGYTVDKDEWYIMQDMEICTHTGTHVESPYHALENGSDVTSMDFRRLIGQAAILDFSDKAPNQAITGHEIDNRGKHIKNDDIVLIKTGLSKYYGTEKYKRPYLETSAVEKLINSGIKCLGVECSGIENRQTDSHEINHRLLFSEGIPLIEDMNNLDKLSDDRVFLFAVPLPIIGLDASPLRPIAVEPCGAVEKLTEMFLDIENVWDGF